MKAKNRLDPNVKGILYGAIAGTVFFVIASLITAFILTKEDVSYHTVKYICFGLTITSSFIAGFVAKKKAKLKGILAGVISSSFLIAAVFMVLLLLNRFKIGEDAYLLIPSGLLFGVLGGIISSNLR